MDSSWLSPSFYEIKTRIGSGSFSNVFRAKLKSNEKAYVAIKIMDLENISSSFEDILQEVQTMKMCDDPNILRCYCR
jgi:serine/threonine-protein kinase OSR1/STK39